MNLLARRDCQRSGGSRTWSSTEMIQERSDTALTSLVGIVRATAPPEQGYRRPSPPTTWSPVHGAAAAGGRRGCRPGGPRGHRADQTPRAAIRAARARLSTLLVGVSGGLAVGAEDDHRGTLNLERAGTGGWRSAPRRRGCCPPRRQGHPPTAWPVRVGDGHHVGGRHAVQRDDFLLDLGRGRGGHPGLMIMSPDHRQEVKPGAVRGRPRPPRCGGKLGERDVSQGDLVVAPGQARPTYQDLASPAVGRPADPRGRRPWLGTPARRSQAEL